MQELDPSTAGRASDLREQLEGIDKQIELYTESADKYFALAGTLAVAIVAVALRTQAVSGSSQAWTLLDAVVAASPCALAFTLHYVVQRLTERGARVPITAALESFPPELSARPFELIQSALGKSLSTFGALVMLISVGMTIFGRSRAQQAGRRAVSGTISAP